MYNFCGVNTSSNNLNSNQVARRNSHSLKSARVENDILRNNPLYLIFGNVTGRHGIRFKFEIGWNQMIGNKNVQWSNFSKEAHFIDSHHDRIHDLILEGLKNHRPILDSEFDSPSLGPILHDPTTDSFMSKDGDDVTVSTGAMAFYLCQEGFLEEALEGGA